MKILIVGSLGFIGSALKSYFSIKHDVFCSDIFELNSKNYFQIKESSDFKKIIRKINFDVIINCSGAADVGKSFANIANDFQLNTINVFEHLDAIKTFSKHTKYLNLSSAAVYGNPAVSPIREDNVAKPISPYGYHKMITETICQEYYEIFGIKTCSIRIFSAYGDGLKKQLFWDLYIKAIESKEVTLFGTGKETRDFIYIKDLVLAIDLLVNKLEFKGDVINVASGKFVEIKEAAMLFFKHLPFKSNHVFNNQALKGYPLNWEADITKLKNLGFKTSYSIEEGIKKTIQWMTKNYPSG